MPCTRRMTDCRADCAHRRLVNDYRAERQRQEIAAENNWRHRDGNDHAQPLITFHAWLKAHRRPARERAA